MDPKSAAIYAQDKVQRGLITTAQANVLMVRLEGVRLVTNSIPRDVRAALNAAVKAGELGHLKKEGLKPEAYFHPNARPRAVVMRRKIEERTAGGSRSVMTHYGDLTDTPEDFKNQ